MERLADIIDRFTDALGSVVKYFSLLLVLLVGTDVAMRYLFSISFVAVRELEWHIYALIFLMGASYTLRQDAHVRVDVAYQRFGPKLRAWINVIGSLVFLFPGCFLVIKTSLPFVEFAYTLNETSPDPGGLPYRWIIKAVIPLSFSLIALQGVSFLIRNALFIVKGKEA